MIFRTLAGHPQPILDQLLAASAILPLEAIMILHHDDCGTTHYTNEVVRANIKSWHQDDGVNVAAVDDIDFGAVTE
jgi:carbonic anhydrase